jgi:cytochrome c-type biogenesis protein CcmE
LATGAAILITVFAFTRPERVVYSSTVSQLAKKPMLGTTVRVEGSLVPGSLCRGPSKCGIRFRLADTSYPKDGLRIELEVRYAQCVIPDMFRDVPGYELNLVADGELHADRRHFDADTLMTRCTGKYEIPRAVLHQAVARPVPPCF